MESMGIEHLFGTIYKGKRVLVTGHTGFKGTWLTIWLKELGAEVIGYSNGLPSEPNHFDVLNLSNKVLDVRDDIRNLKNLNNCLQEHKPDVVFHLAAQPIVRYSYKNPIETFESNVMGTLHVLEACRSQSSVKAVVVITSDKCYHNDEKGRPFQEDDKMGGYDPYSCSKGVAELVTSSYRDSYFNLKNYGQNHNLLIASARAGNVIGGGDWAKDRLIPDIMRATSTGKAVEIRSPTATRPWQHVLEPLSGYLLLGQKLLENDTSSAEGWNFGPRDNEVLTVQEVLNKARKKWSQIEIKYSNHSQNPHEAKLLGLDCSKANERLLWNPIWSSEECIDKTVEWYQAYYEEGEVITMRQLQAYVENAAILKSIWAT